MNEPGCKERTVPDRELIRSVSQFWNFATLLWVLRPPCGRKVEFAFWPFMTVVFPVFLVGCGSTEEPPGEVAILNRPESTSALTASADLGVVLAGDEIRNAFTFVNETAERLVVESDKAIKKSCGCTQIVPQKRELQAGESTEVVMSVHTVGRDRDVHESGLVVWTSASGKEIRVAYSLHATLSVGIRASENPLVFADGEDLVRGKQVRFDSPFPADWKTIQIASNHDQIRVSDIEGDDSGASCRVQCDVPFNKSRIDGSLLVRVDGKKGSDFAGRTMSAMIPATAKQCVLLAAVPSVAMMRMTSDGKGTARVLLFGSAVEASDARLIDGVNCESKVTWRTKRIGKDRVFVDINLADCDRIGEGTAKSLHVTLSTGDSLTIPYVVYRSEPLEEKEKS